MKIEHLYYLLIVASNHSINQASKELFVSQQHLSRVVKEVEDSLHTVLFNRTPSGVELTKDGEVFISYAQQIVDIYREMESFFYSKTLPQIDTDHVIQGECKITFPFFFSLFLDDFMHEVNSFYPNIQLNYEESLGDYSTEQIYDSDRLYLCVDIPEHVKKLSQNKLVSYPIATTHAVVCVNVNSPLASKSVITQEELMQSKVTTYPCDVWDCLNIKNILFKSTNISQHLSSVENNASVCIAPAYIKSGVSKQYPKIALIPFRNRLTLPIYIIHSKNYILSDAEKAIVHFFSDYFHNLNRFAESEKG